MWPCLPWVRSRDACKLLATRATVRHTSEGEGAKRYAGESARLDRHHAGESCQCHLADEMQREMQILRGDEAGTWRPLDRGLPGMNGVAVRVRGPERQEQPAREFVPTLRCRVLRRG